MSIEVEAKIRIGNPDAIRANLSRSGAKFVGRRFEVNGFFDDAARSLLSRDEGLRLRSMREESTRKETAVITFKGPQQSKGPKHGQGTNDLKRREEIEFGIDDYEKASALLARLGYTPTLAFEKRREIWTLMDCELVIDELPVLGFFMEIEGPSENRVRETMSVCDLLGHATITDSYIKMLQEAVRAGKARGPIIRFPT